MGRHRRQIRWRPGLARVARGLFHLARGHGVHRNQTTLNSLAHAHVAFGRLDDARDGRVSTRSRVNAATARAAAAC